MSASLSRTRSSSVGDTALMVLGAVYATMLANRLANFVWRHFIRPHTDLRARYGGGEAWAVVTGGTSGIGRSCAIKLGKAGFHIVLMARTRDDLDQVVSILEKEHKVRALAFSVDAATVTEQDIVTFVEKDLKDKSVAILVNSVGIVNARPCLVEEMSHEKETARMLRVNCGFPVLLTSKLIPKLKQHAKKYGGAAILNVGSLTSSTPMPMLSTYAATKAFVNHWSKCLAAELEGIDVLSVRPALVATPMSGIHQTSLFAPHPDTFAQQALGFLGLAVTSILPYAPHAFQDYLGTIVPESLQASIMLQMHQAKQKEMDQQEEKKEQVEKD